MTRNYGIDFLKGIGLILVAALHIGISNNSSGGEYRASVSSIYIFPQTL